MRGVKETRPCASCGTQLTRLVSQAHGRNWYCDHRCQVAHQPPAITQPRTVKLRRVCECGREFETFPSVAKVHCSRSCSLRYVPRKPKTGELRACLTCRTEFYTPRAVDQRYCSKACANAGLLRSVPVSCVVCGKSVLRPPSQVRIQTCSRACHSLSRVKRPLERIHNGRPAHLDNYGYVLVWEPEHPNRSMKGWQYEHRLVVEREIGRYLTSYEHVDHINEVKNDNRAENLQVLSPSAHSSKTGADMKAARKRVVDENAEYRRLYGPLPGKEH